MRRWRLASSIGPVVGVTLGKLPSAALVQPCAALPLERPTANKPGICRIFFLVIRMHSNHERAHTDHFVWDMARIERGKEKESRSAKSAFNGHNTENRKSCEELLCSSCICGVHKQHVFEEMASAALKEVEEIETRLGALETKAACVEKAMAEVEKKCHRAEEERKGTQETIHESFQHARDVLDRREKELLEEQEQMTGQKLQNLAAQREQLGLLWTMK